MGDAYLGYPEAREGRWASSGQFRTMGICEHRGESRYRPEGPGASRWEKTGTVALGNEQPVDCLQRCYVRDLCYLLSGTQVPGLTELVR